MQFGFSNKKYLSAFGLLGLLLGGAACLWLNAVAQASDPAGDTPLQVRLNTPLNAETAKFGDAFEGVLAEAYHYQGKELPAGTLLKGQVQSARKSYPLALPGYVALTIEQAELPNGTAYQLAADVHAPQSQRVMHPQAQTRKKLMRTSLPFTIVSVATSVPLQCATSLSGGQIFPIALAGRMAAGAALEASRKNRYSPVKTAAAPKRVGYGLLEGTGVTGAYYFLKPSAEPQLAQGAVVPLHFDQKELSHLFDSDPIVLNPAAPTQGGATESAVEGMDKNIHPVSYQKPMGAGADQASTEQKPATGK